LFLNYSRNKDKPKYLFLNYQRNEDEAKYLFLNYRRNEDEAKYLFLNYRRNEDEGKYLFLNYRRSEYEAMYSSTIDDLTLLVRSVEKGRNPGDVSARRKSSKGFYIIRVVRAVQ
jgi:hypothetical protein